MSSLNRIHEYLAIDSGGNMLMGSLCVVIVTWLNGFLRSLVGVGMNGQRGV